MKKFTSYHEFKMYCYNEEGYNKWRNKVINDCEKMSQEEINLDIDFLKYKLKKYKYNNAKDIWLQIMPVYISMAICLITVSSSGINSVLSILTEDVFSQEEIVRYHLHDVVYTFYFLFTAVLIIGVVMYIIRKVEIGKRIYYEEIINILETYSESK